MALTQPILYSKVAFDATKEQTFTFNAIGGSQVVANRLVIKNNSTLAEVYSTTQTTYAFSHTVPANSLINGVYYQAYLFTKDSNNNESVASNIIQFYCYAQPTFAFSNIPSSGIINNSSYNFTVSYNQSEGEGLQQYTFNLYNSLGELLSTSGSKYTGGSVSSIEYSFVGLENNTAYYVECNGVTNGGTQITTGQEYITVSYANPSLYSAMELTNECNGGYIYIQSNIVAINGTSNPTPPIYVNHQIANLSADGSYVDWNKGYELTNDWTLGIWGYGFNYNKPICTFSNSIGETVEVYLAIDNNKTVAVLQTKSVNYPYGYITKSNAITTPSSSDNLNIWARCANNLYEIKIAVLSS